MASNMSKISKIIRPFHTIRCSLFSRECSYKINSIYSHRSARYFHKSCQIFVEGSKINMPALSPTMEQGTILNWNKKEGDKISPGDVLCEIQTDKAVISYEMEEEGILAKIIVPENTENVKLGTTIALMVEEGEDWKDVEIPADLGAAADETPPSSTTKPDEIVTTEVDQKDYHLIGPAVRNILEQYKLDVNTVKGTGPHGELLKGDLLQYVKQHNLKPAAIQEPAPAVQPPPVPPVVPPVSTPAPASAPSVPAHAAAEGEYVDIPLTNMRRTIAKRLTESKTTIPHSYSTIDCNIDKVTELRQDLKKEGVKVSMNDFIVKACAVALRQVPEVNAVWSGESPRLLGDVDISVAVATDSGLITPIVKDALHLGVQDISNTIRGLALKAREGKLKPHEFQGGSFTISNLGMFGVTEFSAVINPPQACILAVGTNRVVLDENNKPSYRLLVTLSSDARLVDDALAAKFLEVFRDIMETPMHMLTQQAPVKEHSML